MKPTALPLIAAVAFAIPAAGCGSSDDAAETATHAAPASPAPEQNAQADQAIAHAALLRLSDLPVGWTAAPDTSTDVDCPAIDAAERRPHEESLRFDSGDQAVQHEAIVMATDADAAAALDAIVSQDTLDCIAQRTEQVVGQGAPAGTQIGHVTVAQLNVPPSGDRTVAARVTIPVTANGLDVEACEDFVFSRVDRGLSLIALVAQGSRPNDGLRTQLAKRGAQRMRAALGDV